MIALAMTSGNAPSGAPQRPTGSVRPGAPPPGQVLEWFKFAMDNLRQVRGFVPKMKALGHIISVLAKR
jgi:hypothetical protein